MIEQVAEKLPEVHWSGPDKLRSRCPACGRKSFSAKETDRGVLVHCFAGCTIQEICAALDMAVSELFNDARPPRQRTNGQPAPCVLPRNSQEATARLLRDYGQKLMTIADIYELHSSKILEQARDLQIDEWTPEELDRALSVVNGAMQKQRLVRALDELGEDFRVTGFKLGENS